jgi:PAS domain S-box-containing protein
MCPNPSTPPKRSHREENYRLLLHAIPDLMLRLNREGVCTDFMPARNFRLFMAEVDWCGKHISEILPPALAQQRMHYVERALQTGELQVYEQQIQINEQLQYEEVRVIRCSDDEVLIIIRNISERKYAEAALQESQQQFQKLARNIPGMIYQLRLSSIGAFSFPYISPFSQELFELDPGLIQQNADLWLACVYPGDRESLLNSIATSARSLQAWEWSGRFITPSGKLKWIQGHSRPELQADGSIIWDGVIVDISERKATELALHQTEKQYRNIFEAVSDAILIQDLETGMLVDVNPAACQMYGYAYDELLALEPKETIHPDSLPIFEQFLDAVKSNQTFSGQALHIRQNGTIFHVEMHGSRCIYQGKLAALYTIRDISDRNAAEKALRRSEAQLRQQAIDLERTLQKLRRTQAQLIQTEKMSSLGQLVAGIAHEINNPVNFIAGNIHYANSYFNDMLYLLALYQKCYPQPTPEIQAAIDGSDLEFIVTDLAKLLESMEAGVDRIQQIVQSLRTFSRLDEAAFKSVNIHDGIDSVLTVLQSRLHRNYRGYKIRILKNYAKLPLVQCYAGQINQVFLNLISNAIDSLEEAVLNEEWLQQRKSQNREITPQIEIHTEQLDPHWIRIRIIDNGLGIPADVQARMFDPFFTTKPIGKGTGMGLSTSYQIVAKQHDGMLTCRSTLYQGAEFRIKIPIYPTEIR